LTRFIVDSLEKRTRPYKIIFSSSYQSGQDNPYGQSKKEAEDYIRAHVKTGTAVIYRLPGVFGKWCRPNYNSVVANFCHNSIHHIPLEIRDPDFQVNLVYIDDVVKSFIKQIGPKSSDRIIGEQVEPVYP